MTPPDPHEQLVDAVADVADNIVGRAVECREAAESARSSGHDAEWLIGRSEAHMEDGEAILEMLNRLTNRMSETNGQLA